MRAALALVLWCPVLGLGSCTYFTGDNHVLVTSTPAGASILVDGTESGMTTPALLELGGITGGDHLLTMRKRGYTEESRKVFHYTTTYSSVWGEGAANEVLPTFPIFWTIGDVVVPFGVRWRYVPHDLHVQLYREGEAPVHEDGTGSASK